ncbi:hypothetical protein DL764_007103 [Monosporascus ibericus]|uniref:Uncharacterized protein n=1 Tax=Monosporascus ibericus TaxID=155417 RepID=A0A4Q4T321_9PEZI|nr:hypothetical protein DL764_007103 [Monosporascus ibericus]
MAPPASISEDWEELVDDAFSVISVSTSDDFNGNCQSSSNECLIHASSPTNPTVGQCSLPSRGINSLPIRAEPHGVIAPDTNSDDGRAPDENAQDDEVERQGMDMKDVTEPEESSNQSFYKSLDWDNVDPTFLLKIDNSLIKLITQITGLLEFKGNLSLPNGALDVKYGCQKLLGYLQQLSPVLEGYSKHWDPKHATGNIPLDPGLKTWMLKLRIELLSLEDKLQKDINRQAAPTQVARGLRPRVPDVSEYDKPLDASSYVQILATFSAQMEVFMPILETDYNDFHTAGMTFPSIEEKEQPPPQTTDNSAGPCQSRPGYHLWYLRRELYELKDQISACISDLDTIQQGGATKDSCLVVLIASSYRSIKASLDLMLSNHPSDWIDHSLNGGLTYAEFCELDPDIIRSLNLRLKEITDDLFLESRKVQSRQDMDKPDNADDQDETQTQAISELPLSQLYNMEEVLQSVFRLRSSPISKEEEA